MTVEHREGDLFAQGIRALGQGVNCHGVMGTGIAKEFRRRWPAMYDDYRLWFHNGWLRPGRVHTWLNLAGDAVVFNLATQDLPGRTATLDAVRESLTVALANAATLGVPELGIPRLGCGIGGLDWPDVAKVIDDVAGGSTVNVVVVSLPDATVPA